LQTNFVSQYLNVQIMHNTEQFRNNKTHVLQLDYLLRIYYMKDDVSHVTDYGADVLLTWQ
jgi:hypothetical protein